VARRVEAQESEKLGEVQGAKLEPIGVVERVLTRPDGTTVTAQVPVYPPFRLAEAPSRKPARTRSAPSLKRARSGARSEPGESAPMPRASRRRPRTEGETG
jgi:hypothetical protein